MPDFISPGRGGRDSIAPTGAGKDLAGLSPTAHAVGYYLPPPTGANSYGFVRCKGYEAITAADSDQMRRLLKAFDFKKLFIERLGWDRHQARPLVIPIDGGECTLDAVAEKRGMVVYLCSPTSDGGIPDAAARRRIEKEAAKAAYEHIIVFSDADRGTQLWQWVKRQQGKPAAFRQHTFHKD